MKKGLFSCHAAWPTKASSTKMMMTSCTQQPKLLAKKGMKNGFLKLRIEADSERILVEVAEARQLCSKWTTTCDSYVQVALCPVSSSDSMWSSAPVAVDNNPAYNQTCTRILSPGDSTKRLWIAVYHRDDTKKCSEFLGCMSFGVKHLISKNKKKSSVCGWYHLLSEDLGHRKHLLAQKTFPDSEKSVRHKSTTDPEGTSCTSVRLAPCPDPDVPNLNDARMSPDSPQSRVVSDINKRLRGLDNHTIVVHKSSSGFGFTVKNTCPVKVGRVKSHGPSEKAGLMKGDYVIKINGQNVSRSSATSVATIVRQSFKSLALEVCRAPPKKSAVKKFIKHVPFSPCHSRGKDLTKTSLSLLPMETCSDDEYAGNAENVAPSCDLSQTDSGYSKSSSNCGQNSNRDSKDSRSEGSETSDSGSCHRSSHRQVSLCTLPDTKDSTSTPLERERSDKSSAKSNSYRRWDPEISVISTSESLRSRHVISRCNINSVPRSQESGVNKDSLSSWYQWLETSSEQQMTSPWQHDDQTVSSCPPGIQAPHCSLAGSHISEGHFLSGSDCQIAQSKMDQSENMDSCLPNSTFSTTSSTRHSVDEAESFCEDFPCDFPGTRAAAIENLISCERQFTRIMASGIQQFSRPLRHCILTTEQHTTLFQNLEKLVALSEFHLRQLNDNGCHGYHIEDHQGDVMDDTGVGKIYSQKIKLLCGAYRSYFDGLSEALNLLQQLRNNRQFVTFVQNSHESLTIDAFVRQPQHHLVALLRCMTEVLRVTPQQHRDWSSLFNLLNGVKCF